MKRSRWCVRHPPCPLWSLARHAPLSSLSQTPASCVLVVRDGCARSLSMSSCQSSTPPIHLNTRQGELQKAIAQWGGLISSRFQAGIPQGQGGAVVAAGVAVVVAVVGGLWGLGRKGTKGNTKPAAKAEGGADTQYTLEELAQYDGVVNKGSPILIGVDGTVFDMTLGKEFYGPGGPYEAFAGRCVYPLAASDQAAPASVLPPASAVLDSRTSWSSEGVEGGRAHTGTQRWRWRR